MFEETRKQADYHARNQLSKFVGKVVKGRGVPISKENIFRDRVYHNVCLVSVELNLNGKWVEFDHLNVHLKKRSAYENVNLYQPYEFMGEVYRYVHMSKVNLSGQWMSASLESYSLQDAKSFHVLNPVPTPENLSLFQETRARKQHIAFEKILPLPLGERERYLKEREKTHHIEFKTGEVDGKI